MVSPTAETIGRLRRPLILAPKSQKARDPADVADSSPICDTDSRPLWGQPPFSGRGAVWIARLTGGQKVAGSNPVAPTDKSVQHRVRPQVLLVPPGRGYLVLRPCFFLPKRNLIRLTVSRCTPSSRAIRRNDQPRSRNFSIALTFAISSWLAIGLLLQPKHQSRTQRPDPILLEMAGFQAPPIRRFWAPPVIPATSYRRRS